MKINRAVLEYNNADTCEWERWYTRASETKVGIIMKAEEIPEKIYIQPSAIEQLPHQNIVYTKPLADNSIEYTRTDAFIEKACKYLEPIIFSMNSGDRPDTDKFIEDLKNYMKGE